MGNLFSYLGLNQAYFLLPSFFNVIWSHYRGACATNGLFASVICCEILLSNAKYFVQGKRLTFSAAFQLLFLPLCINSGVQCLSSPTPDVFVNLLTFKIIADLIRCLESGILTFEDLFIIVYYSVLGIIMKMSFIGIGGGALLLACYLLISKKLWRLRPAIIGIGVFMILMIPWIIRGVLSSGYIAFPIQFLGMPVDWKMQKGVLVEFEAFIKGFARTHLHGQPAIDAAYNLKWVPAWLKRMATTFGFIVPVLLFLGSVILLRIRKISPRQLNLTLAPIGVSILFWLFTAPDIRFAVFTFWSLGLAPVAFIIANLELKKLRQWFIVFIYLGCIGIMLRNWNKDLKPLGDLPDLGHGVFVTKSGLKINTTFDPIHTDDWRISDCTFPCSVYPDSALVLRGKTIREGFKIDHENKR
jgi:hypothetical protein